MTSGSLLHFRDSETGKSVLSFDSLDEDSGWQSFLAFNDTLFTVNKNGLVESWEIKNLSGDQPEKRLKRSWKSGNSRNSPVLHMLHHPTSPLVFLAHADGSVTGWDSVQGFCTHNFKPRSSFPISAIAFHPDSKCMELFCASEDGSIVVWDLLHSRVLCTFSSHVSSVTGFFIDYQNKSLISVSRDKTIAISSLLDGKNIRTIPVGESIEGLHAINSSSFAVIGDKGHVTIWDISRGSSTMQSRPLVSEGHKLTQIMPVGQNDKILVVSTELQLISLSVSALTEIDRIMGHFGEVTDIAILNENLDCALAVSTNGPEVCIFPNASSMSCRLLSGHTEAILALAYSPAGDFLVSGSRDHSLRIWKSPQNQTNASVLCEGHTEAVCCVAIAIIKSPSHAPSQSDGSFFIASASSDLTLKLWSFDPQSNRVSSVWTVKAHDKEINAITFSPDSKYIITASQDKLIKLWDVSTGQLVRSLSGHKRGVWSVSCTFAQEMLLVSGSADRNVKIWRLSDDFACIKTFEGHSNSVLRVSFINNGLQIISSGSDGLLKVWDVKRNECIVTLDEHVDRIWALAVQRDGERIITGDASATIKIWTDSTDEDIAEAIRKQDQILLKEQDLQVYLIRKDFKNAILLAMNLEQPFRLSSLFEELVRDKTVLEAMSLLSSLFDQFTVDQNAKLIEYIREWNLSYKRAFTSHLILAAILRSQGFKKLFEEKSSIIKDLFISIIPYTDKHFDRTDDLLISSHLVDFALLNMQ